MRTSIIAGLTLVAAAMAFAGPSHAYDPAQQPAAEPGSSKAPPAKRARAPRNQPNLVAEAPTPLMRIPAHPAVRDCVHVSFPQCGRGYDALNDGTFGRY
jgi:hypothetical protein